MPSFREAHWSGLRRSREVITKSDLAGFVDMGGQPQPAMGLQPFDSEQSLGRGIDTPDDGSAIDDQPGDRQGMHFFCRFEHRSLHRFERAVQILAFVLKRLDTLSQIAACALDRIISV
jgi:hypothetical protein